MPKSVKNIINLSGGINTDLSSNVLPDDQVVDCKNLDISNPGKINAAIGFALDAITGQTILNPDSVYSFRTDDNSENPKEYLLFQDAATTVRLRDHTVGSWLSPLTVDDNVGIIYSNGTLFLYPLSSGTAKVWRAGGITNADSFDINYDTLKPVTRLTLNDAYVSGSATPDVTFKLNEDKNLDGFATVEIDVAGDTYDGGHLYINYNGTEYYLGNIPAKATTAAWLTELVTDLNDTGIPLEATESGTVLSIQSLVYGPDGNGWLTFYKRASVGGAYGAGLYQVKLEGGGVESPEDVTNIDKLLESGTYSFYASLVLWDGSETNIDGTKCSVEFDERTKLHMTVLINDTTIFDSDFVTGLKVYLSSENFEPSLLCEYRHFETERFKFFNESNFSTNATESQDVDIVIPLRSTFSFETGYDIGEQASPTMREFIIVNNRGYALNVNYGTEWHQDRIIISPQGKPFLLPENNRIDIVTEDGDEYIAAESFGSLLYCFKRKTLFILNISSNDPSSFYLADSSFGAGVNSKACICKTEVGLFWANENGLYYHNGQGQIQDISKNKIKDEWESISGTDIRAGYDPLTKKVLFVKNHTIFCFDIRSQSFSKFDNNIGTTGDKSNFFLLDDQLSFFDNGDAKNFDMSRGTPNWSITTKDFVLGRRSVRKKVRRFYVTFEEQAVDLNNINFYYSLDNTNNFVSINGEFINNDDTVKNTIAMFDLPRSITAYSVQIKVESALDVTIKDISIIYRDKLPK